MRGEIRTVGGLTLIVDCYNANPESVRAALELLTTYPELGPRVAVLGTMLELGSRHEALHREVLEDALDPALDLVVATGAFADAARELGVEGVGGDGPPRVIAEDDPEAAYPRFRDALGGGEVVLLKASRGVSMERMIPLLEEDFGDAPGAAAGEA